MIAHHHTQFDSLKALIKIDALLALLNVGSGVAFFFKLFSPVDVAMMVVGIVGNLVWVAVTFLVVRLEHKSVIECDWAWSRVIGRTDQRERP